eukprot:3844737-Rhodomonas_salina.2
MASVRRPQVCAQHFAAGNSAAAQELVLPAGALCTSRMGDNDSEPEAAAEDMEANKPEKAL